MHVQRVESTPPLLRRLVVGNVPIHQEDAAGTVVFVEVVNNVITKFLTKNKTTELTAPLRKRPGFQPLHLLFVNDSLNHKSYWVCNWYTHNVYPGDIPSSFWGCTMLVLMEDVFCP